MLGMLAVISLHLSMATGGHGRSFSDQAVPFYFYFPGENSAVSRSRISVSYHLNVDSELEKNKISGLMDFISEKSR